jgi:hypothetical protein
MEGPLRGVVTIKLKVLQNGLLKKVLIVLWESNQNSTEDPWGQKIKRALMVPCKR